MTDFRRWCQLWRPRLRRAPTERRQIPVLDLARPKAYSLARELRDRGVEPALALALGELFESVAQIPHRNPGAKVSEPLRGRP